MAEKKEKSSLKKIKAASSPKLTFKFIFPPQLPDLHVSGAWAGVTPKGEINIHFYSERRPHPNPLFALLHPKAKLRTWKTILAAT